MQHRVRNDGCLARKAPLRPVVLASTHEEECGTLDISVIAEKGTRDVYTWGIAATIDSEVLPPEGCWRNRR